jgi:type IV pilus assembly protein PilN
MIRINLLPFRAAREQENIRRQISIFVLLVGFLVLVLGYYYLDFTMKVSALEKERAAKLKEKDRYQDTLKKIKENEKKIGELKQKLDVIRELENNKRGPVRMLIEIAEAVPKDKLWLSSLNEDKGILTLTGTAMDNDTVALFMKNLEKAEHIKSVDLTTTKLEHLKDYKQNVTGFTLRCKTYLYKEKEPEPTTRSKRRRRPQKK